MQDLESGLSYMLRSEVSLIKFISGEKLLALKEFLRILVKVGFIAFKKWLWWGSLSNISKFMVDLSTLTGIIELWSLNDDILYYWKKIKP